MSSSIVRIMDGSTFMVAAWVALRKRVEVISVSLLDRPEGGVIIVVDVGCIVLIWNMHIVCVAYHIAVLGYMEDLWRTYIFADFLNLYQLIYYLSPNTPLLLTGYEPSCITTLYYC
jgi:hypothetical protein